MINIMTATLAAIAYSIAWLLALALSPLIGPLMFIVQTFRRIKR